MILTHMFLKDTAFSKQSSKEANLNYPRTKYKSAWHECKEFGVFSSNYIGIPELSLPPLNPVLHFLLFEGNFFLSRT